MKQLAVVLLGMVVACGSKGDSADKSDRSGKSDKSDDKSPRQHRNEAKLMLHNLEKKLKAYYAEHDAYPAGQAKPLPATAPCCKQADHLCAVTTEWDSDPVWKQIEFRIDEPNRYQYIYASDGKTVQAMAIGQDDCDDAEQRTYTLNTTRDGTFELKGISGLADDKPDLDAIKTRQLEAEKRADQAMKDAKDAQDRVERLQADLADFSKRLDAAVEAVTAAKTQAEREHADQLLKQLQREKAEMEARIAEAKAASAKATRRKGVNIPKECLDNPLAKGCN